MLKTLEELIAIIRKRKGSSVEESYTKKLLSDKNLSVKKNGRGHHDLAHYTVNKKLRR